MYVDNAFIVQRKHHLSRPIPLYMKDRLAGVTMTDRQKLTGTMVGYIVFEFFSEGNKSQVRLWLESQKLVETERGWKLGSYC